MRRRRTGYVHVIKVPGIYRITTPDGVYVGQAADIRSRWSGHLTLLRKGKHHTKRLQQAFDTHGEASFMFEALEFTGEGDAAEDRWGAKFAPCLLNATPLSKEGRSRNLIVKALSKATTDELRAELARRQP